MKRSTGILGLALIVACPLSLADAYRYEVSLDHNQTETGFSETDTTSVRGTYYLRPVETDDVPLAEAAFIGQASSVTIGLERRSQDVGFVGIAFNPSAQGVLSLPRLNTDSFLGALGDLDADTTSAVNIFGDGAFPIALTGPIPNSRQFDQNEVSIAGEYVAENGWIAGLGFSRWEDDGSTSANNFSSSFDTETETVRFSVGKYVAPMTTIAFEYSDTSNELSSVFESVVIISGFPTVPPILSENRSSSDNSTRGYSIKAKTLVSQWSYLHKLQIDLGYDVLKSSFRSTFNNSSVVQTASTQSYARRWRVGYAFYPSNDIELGLGFSSLDAEFGKQDTLNLSAQWFVKPRLAIRADYVSTDTGRSFEDSDGFGLGITGRF